MKNITTKTAFTAIAALFCATSLSEGMKSDDMKTKEMKAKEMKKKAKTMEAPKM